ncbi:MAG: glycosyltransferase [Phycisphaerales bacterium]|nr:glycosyltransferase [Phycisphaerales bacterium]
MNAHQTARISVVLPTCDRASMTQRCLTALAVQTHGDVEIIVIDDGSKDATPGMLEDFQRTHPELNLVVLRNEKNRGANASRNRGVQAATGDFIAFLDSDCLAEPTWLEQLVKPMEDTEVAAVTGLVLDPDPRTIYDLAFRGTHRIGNAGPARRLIAGNLCVRREPLVACMWSEDGELPPPGEDGQPDVSFSGACDEESLALDLKAAGWKLVAHPSAVVLHEHYYDRRSFYRQAFHGGQAAADFVYRHRLPHRRDMIPFMLAWLSLPLAVSQLPFLGWWPLLVPAGFMALAIAAILYNDLCLKGKTPWETTRSFPVLLAYYHVRLLGYLKMTWSRFWRRDR